MQTTGTFGALNSGIATPNSVGNRKRPPAPRIAQPKVSTRVQPNPVGNLRSSGLSGVGSLPDLSGQSTGPLGKAPVNAFAGMQPMLSRALASGANAQSPVGDRLDKLPRRRKAV